MCDRQRGAGSRERPQVPQWLVERLAAGELALAEAKRVQDRLAEAGELHRLRAIDASNRAILAEHPPAAVGAEVRRRLARVNETAALTRARRVWSALALSGAAAALLLLLFVSAEPGTEGVPLDSERPSSVRLKGLEPRLVIYKKTAAGAVRLESPVRAAPGDLVQVAYVAAGRKFGVVVSIDSTGAVMLHLPEGPGPAAPLISQSEIPLPHAFELDAVPGVERFLFVTADHPFEVDAVTSALRDGAPLPPDVSTHQVHLEKVDHEESR